MLHIDAVSLDNLPHFHGSGKSVDNRAAGNSKSAGKIHLFHAEWDPLESLENIDSNEVLIFVHRH